MQRILPSGDDCRQAVARAGRFGRDHPLFDVATSRRIEARALAALPAHALMQRAGVAVARLALAVAPHARRLWIAAGAGNNGGDGLASARHLARDGRRVEVGLVGDPARLPPDARAAFDAAVAAGVPVHVGSDPAGWLADDLGPDDLVIDALLGIGANRPPQGPLAAAVQWLNARSCPVLAVDVPSGLAADTGQPFGDDVVIARHTLSLLCLRPGLFTGAGRDHAGSVWLDELGVPGVEASDEAPTAWLSASRPLPAAPRRHASNKGSFGDVIVVGGATGMTGAALLAARAAQAAGAGRVFVHLLQAAGQALAADPLRPELMFRGAALLADAAHLARATVVCGCGGGDAVAGVLSALLLHAGRLVLDADALNAVARDEALMTRLQARATSGRPTVMTPHPLEAARLLGASTGQVQADRLRSAARLVERCACVTVLKGSGSIVAGPGRVPHVNASGNASLASAGTGDVLAGFLGGAWGQAPTGGDGFEAAVQAVAQHGAAADEAAVRSLRAGDLVEALQRY